MALDNLRGGTKRVVEENTPLNNLRGGTKRVVIVDGGGGSVDYAKTVQRAETMPTADASNAGQQFLYSGESDATYTHGYIYENVATTTSSSASAEQTVGSTLSDIAVDLDTLEAFTGWTTDNSLQIFYTADGWSVDTTSLGVTYTGTPNVGDAITITYTAESTSYAWTQIDVQPAPSGLPDQTGQSGKFLTTDGTDASWGNAVDGTLRINLAQSAGGTEPVSWYYNGTQRLQVSYFNSSGTLQASIKGLNNKWVGFQFYATNTARYIAPRQDLDVSSGYSDHRWINVYTAKINNGSDIAIPTTGGTMAVIGVNTTATLAVADWSSNTQTVTVSGVTATSVVFVSPAPASASDYASAGILCTAQAANSLTFTCTTTPTNAITVNVVCL